VLHARACSPTRDRAVATQHTREVVSPQRTDLVLAAHVPDVELGVLIRDRFDVEADGGDGGDVLVELELVEDCCKETLAWSPAVCSQTACGQAGRQAGGQASRTGLSGGIEAQHQQPHLLGSEDLVHHLRYRRAHGAGRALGRLRRRVRVLLVTLFCFWTQAVDRLLGAIGGRRAWMVEAEGEEERWARCRRGQTASDERVCGAGGGAGAGANMCSSLAQASFASG
jgi:hypothetical protein